MKKNFTILLTAAILCISLCASAQVKKPTLMIIPSDVWCNEHGYMSEINNQGLVQKVANYRLALQSDPVLVSTITRINTLMADRGFPLKNLESTLRNTERYQAEAALITSKTSGASIAESPVDMLFRTAQPDIILQLTWTVNQVGPKRSVTYALQGLDAYTDVQIAGCEGTGAQSMTSEVPILIEEAVSANMDIFTAQLQKYFDELQNQGRPVAIDIRIFDNGSGLDMESEFNGHELSEVIDKWMNENTVEHMFNKAAASEDFIMYDQVRIPLYRTNGTGMDAEYFIRGLRKYLSAEPYNIQSKLYPRGLGRALLILGEK